MATASQQHNSSQFSAHRLRTPRQRRRALLDNRDKQLLALHREQETVARLRNAIPWVPLEPPVVRGWKRSFVLRDDVARRPDAALYERILDHINTVQYSHRRDFKKKKRYRGRKIHVLRGQHLLKLDPWHWRRCGFSPAEAAQFDLVASPPDKPHGPPRYHYVIREPWRYVLRVQLNVITRFRRHDEELEAAKDALKRHFEDPRRRFRLNRLLHGKGSWLGSPQPDRHYSSRRPFRNLPLHALIAAF